MSRQQIRFNPAEKLFESFNDFSGGMNTETSNDRLKNNEFPTLENVDLQGRGSAKRRTGRMNYLNAQIGGKAQGIFFYYRKGQSAPDIITAVSGKLYISPPVGIDSSSGIIVNSSYTEEYLPVGEERYFRFTPPASGSYTIETTSYLDLKMKMLLNSNGTEIAYDDDSGEGSNPKFTVSLTAGTLYILKVFGFDLSVGGSFVLRITPPNGVQLPEKPAEYVTKYTALPITGMTEFQKNLPIEAAQYNDTLFIATGTNLVEYNGTVAKVVEPYKPSSMEAIYIGTNGLADNPDGYIQDGESAELSVSGIRPNMRSGVTNMPVIMTAYISKPASMTSVEYKWQYRKVGETSWTQGRDFTADTAGKAWTFTPRSTGKYEFNVIARKAGTTTPAPDFTLTNYPINDVEDKTNQVLPTASMKKCRKIILHWDRILLAKDDTNPHQMYISDLNNPRYFPTTNTINFDANKQEPITALVRYRDMLVIFTKTTIQSLTGKSPEDYRRTLIHDGIGCVADRTAQVVGNFVIFLSSEGIRMLSPMAFTLETLNVKIIDHAIKNNIKLDQDACAIVHDDQYWICFPSRSEIFRYYYDVGVWVKDTSSKLNISQFIDYENQVYELTLDGKLYKQNKLVYNDVGEVYRMSVESKYFDLSIMFNYKKLKNLYILARHFQESVDMSVSVYADSTLSLTPEKGQAVINPNGSVTWQSTSEPNMHFYSGTVLGQWILGVNPLGDVQLSVQKARVRGKCRRVKVMFSHAQDSPCEVYAFGLEFKAKKI